MRRHPVEHRARAARAAALSRDQIYERTATKVKDLFAHVPEELRLEKIELNRTETRVHNFIEFITSGRATPTLADALSQAEEQVKSLSADIQSMEAAQDHAFTPAPRLEHQAHQQAKTTCSPPAPKSPPSRSGG